MSDNASLTYKHLDIQWYIDIYNIRYLLLCSAPRSSAPWGRPCFPRVQRHRRIKNNRFFIICLGAWHIPGCFEIYHLVPWNMQWYFEVSNVRLTRCSPCSDRFSPCPSSKRKATGSRSAICKIVQGTMCVYPYLFILYIYTHTYRGTLMCIASCFRCPPDRRPHDLRP